MSNGGRRPPSDEPCLRGRTKRRDEVGTQIKLLVGTRKGAFIYSTDEKRQRWEISEPILPGWSFYSMAADLRGKI